jgi:hypothetical protein
MGKYAQVRHTHLAQLLTTLATTTKRRLNLKYMCFRFTKDMNEDREKTTTIVRR